MTALVVALAVALVVGAWLRTQLGFERQELTRASAALELAKTGLSAETTATLAAADKLDERLRTIEKQAAELSQLRGTAQESARRSDEYLGMIQVAQKERDGWKTMYYRESAEHGNAQAMLFREIGRCAAAARAAGRALKITPAVEEALREHRGVHAEPAWQAIGQKPAPLESAAAAPGPGA